MTSSNINGVIGDVRDAADDLNDGASEVADDEGDAIEENVLYYYSRDPEWLGRTKSALRNQHRRLGRGKYANNVYINGLVAPHAAIAEFGSGDRAGETWDGGPDPNPDPPEAYRGDFDFDAPPFSRELYESIRAWIRTKPIITDDEAEEAFEISSVISDEGTYEHAFFRPAWEDRAGKPSRGYDDSPIVRHVERMAKRVFDG